MTDLGFAIFERDSGEAPRFEFRYPLVNRIGRGDVVVAHVQRECAPINFSTPRWVGFHRLQFGSEQECVPHPTEIEWLFSQAVPDKGQCVALSVPYSNREHANGAFDCFLYAPGIEPGQQRLGVRMAAPRHLCPLLFKLSTKVLVVVDLPVERDYVPV